MEAMAGARAMKGMRYGANLLYCLGGPVGSVQECGCLVRGSNPVLASSFYDTK